VLISDISDVIPGDLSVRSDGISIRFVRRVANTLQLLFYPRSNQPGADRSRAQKKNARPLSIGDREARGKPRCIIVHPYTRTWSTAELALVGTMTDQDLAGKLGISCARVAFLRKGMGIVPFDRKRKDRQWLDEEDAMLGVQIDVEVAVALKITRVKVSKRRKALGIRGQNGKKRVIKDLSQT